MFTGSNALQMDMDYPHVSEQQLVDSKSHVSMDESKDTANKKLEREAGGKGLLPIPKKSRTIKTDKPRPFLCPICTRGFVRQEHLKRHQRSHTNEKPFLCVFCGRCFARRDLVLRHQHKLHASLVGKTPSGNISSSSSSNEISDTDELRSMLHSGQNSDPDKNIIKIIGNKESILPTPSNPMAKTAAQLKKAAREAAASMNVVNPVRIPMSKETSSSPSLHTAVRPIGTPGESMSKTDMEHPIEINPVRKRKRHASFSATNAFTYVNDHLNSDEIAKQLEFTENIPHQVGFATPQLTAQELADKLMETGGIDVEALGLPQDFSLDDFQQPSNSATDVENRNTGNSIKTGNNDNCNYSSSGVPNNWNNGYSLDSKEHHINARNSSITSFSNVPMTPSAYLLKSTPSISNFLTMGTICGGAGGYNGANSSDSNLTPFKYESFDSIDSYLEMLPVKSKAKSMRNTEHGHSGDPKSSKNIPPNSKDVLLKGNAISPNQEEDLWLSEFIYGPDLSPGFKVDLDSINDVGFAEVVSNSSISASSSIKDSVSMDSAKPIFPKTVLTNQKRKRLPTDIKSVSPVANNNPSGSNSPYSTNRKSSFSLGPEITSLFNSRQKALFDNNAGFHLMGPTPSPMTASSDDSSPDLNDASARFRMPNRVQYFTSEFRDAIIKDSNLQPNLFPTAEELNNYVKLYQREFHRFFPFIHLHTLVPSLNNYPIVLSITMIGALYGFHSSHAMLLSNMSWLKIRSYLNEIKEDYEHTPLWLIQSMVLLIFFGIFSNDLKVTKTMNSRIVTLIKLVKLTKLNLPLETMQMPPIESDHVLEYQDNPVLLNKIRAQYNTPEQVLKNFQYFITAQGRIRTCHMILLISNLFTSLVGLQCCLHSIDLKCGVPCFYENLYLCENALQWGKTLSKYHIILDSKFSLIQLANGYEDYQHCLMYLSTGSQYYFETSKVSFKTLLSMLISVHEKIFLERNNLKEEINIQINEMKWRMNSRPLIESMLKYWESLYIKNGGILTRNEENIPLINENPAMSLIIVLHLFANIRKCVYLTDVIRKVWLKQWSDMNQTLDNFCSDWDSLREATDHALSVIDFWADTVSIMKTAERTAIGTPIFSITCIFSSILIVSEHMRHVEAWAQEFDTSKSMPHVINPYDRMLWLKSEQVLKKVEDHLLPKGYNNQSYAEFLRSQAGGALDVDVLDNDLAQKAMKPDTPIEFTIGVIIKARLSSRSLYLGVRILGDAPIWPVAILFAHALQARAIYNVKGTKNVVPSAQPRVV